MGVRHRCLALAIVAMIGACDVQRRDQVRPNHDELVRGAVDSSLAGFFGAAKTGNVDGMLAYLTADALLLEPGTRAGREEFGRAAREAFGPDGGITSIVLRRDDLFVHRDVAYDIGEYDEGLRTVAGAVSYQGNYFIRWERGKDGTWRIDRLVTGPRAAPGPVWPLDVVGGVVPDSARSARNMTGER